MDMQDNEFDAIFHSKLDDFEAEPSGKVWNGIDEELSAKKRRAIFMPILRIAASIILVLGLGILFFYNRDKAVPVKGGKAGLVKTVQPQVKQPETVAPVKQPEPVKTAVQQPVVNSIARFVTNKKGPQQVKPAQKDVIIDLPVPGVVQKVVPQQLIADVEPPKKTDITQPVVPGPETPLVTKTTENIGSTQVTPQLTAQVLATDAAAKPAKRRGIHNFGDLVNIVVAKVDKRKDKAIRFTDSDDDESTVTAVNIGPVKINRDAEK
ncbi:MAG: hypothetical protein ACHQHN_05155 [Sphingobacteriales bacterium]